MPIFIELFARFNFEFELVVYNMILLKEMLTQGTRAIPNVGQRPNNQIYKHTFIHLIRNTVYQSPLILTELFQHNLINVYYLTACYLYQVIMTLHFLNGVANDAESTQNSKITSYSLF